MKALSIAALAALASCLACGTCTAVPLCGSATAAQTVSAPPQNAPSEQDDASIADLQRTLSAKPDWTEGWWKLGTMAYEAQRFQTAKPALLKVVQAAPQMGVAWGLLGLTEFELKDYTDALTHLERADALAYSGDDEVQRVSVYHYALLLIRNGNFERATAVLARTFGSSPNAQVTFALGLAMLHIQLLPTEVDPSQEAVIAAAGALAAERDQALPEFPAFIASHPDLPFAHFAYGSALENAGRAQEALAEMRAETSISPASPLPWSAISRLEGGLGNAAKARAADLKAVTLSHTKGAKDQQLIAHRYAIPEATAHSSDDDLWKRAMQAYASGQYAPAMDALKPWLKTHPADGTAWAVLGLCEFALHDDGSALLHLERGDTFGLHASPDAVRTARYTIGILLLHAGDFEHAGDVLASVLKLFPADEKAKYALGLTLLRRPDLPTSPSRSDAPLVNAAGQIVLLLQDSRYDEAFPLFKALLKQHPQTPFLHYAYGTALMALSEFDEATAQMQAETAISPGSALPYVRLASIALRQHRPADAIAPATRAIALAPTAPDAHYLLGRAALETGDNATAIRELNLASKLDPGSPEVHFNLARAYAKAKMNDQAASERATFARLNDLAQAQKSGDTHQIYTGPREQDTVTSSLPASPH